MRKSRLICTYLNLSYEMFILNDCWDLFYIFVMDVHR